MQKFLNLEPKMPYLGILGCDFEKPLSYLKSAPSNLPCCKVSWKKNKNLKFGTKNARFLYFGAGIWKYHCQIWNQCPRICLATRFGANIDILKFRIKKAWYEYFWTGSWRLYLKSVPSNLSNCKISWNNEVSKFETKRAFFWAKI